ncbi:MAG TPA: hypothetical protein VLJ17_12285 [Xanthobacteraceae bacterium]|nr:hypothetical protein [Xanthobacteraceae bacterium]
MRHVVAITFVTLALMAPSAVSAGERVVDAALGAASGAIVAGPVGLVAGGVIGFAAGPDIAHGLGLHHHHHYHHYYGHHLSAANRGGARAAEAGPDGR